MISPRVKKARIAILVLAVCLVTVLVHRTASDEYSLLSFKTPATEETATQAPVLAPETELTRNNFGFGDRIAKASGSAVKNTVASLIEIIEETTPTVSKLDKYKNNEKAKELFATEKEFRFTEEYLSNLLEVDQQTVAELTEKHKLFVQRAFIENKFSVFGTSVPSGRGVVIVGGGDYNWLALINIEQLRATGSTLPVEVYIPTEDEYDAEFCAQILPTLDAKCVLGYKAIPAKLRNSKSVSGFQYKLYAFFASAFEEILFLDSDNVVVRDPASMFASPAFKKTGLVLWPDCWSRTTSPDFYKIAGLKVGRKPVRGISKDEPDSLKWNYHDLPGTLPNPASETGMILLNKAKHVNTLLLAYYYNFFGPDYYYPLLTQGGAGEGDKDTFPAAAHVLGEPYYQVKTSFSFIGYHENDKFNSKALGHFDPDQDFKIANGIADVSHPDLVFMHLSYPKLFPYVLDVELLRADNTHRRLYLSSTEKSGYDFELQIWNIFTQLLCEDYTFDAKTSKTKAAAREMALKMKVGEDSLRQKTCKELHLPHLEFLRNNPET